MPDSVLESVSSSVKSTASARKKTRRGSNPALDAEVDTDNKLARAARSTQRLAQLSQAPQRDTTLDLFAEDIERAALQALNTDIRQGTLNGFELPEVFLAAVPTGAVADGPADATTARRAARVMSDAHGAGAGPAAQAPDGAEGALEQAEALVSEQARIAGQEETPPAAIAGQEEAPSAVHADSAAPVRAPSESDETAEARALSSIAAAAADPDRAHASQARPAPPEPAPGLDRARVTAFADTVDALYAVIADQRRSASAHSRRMKTMLTIIVCGLLVTVATGVAQTVVLMRMARESDVQQQRIEQSMLNQQATLASLFDTDSANFGMPNAPRQTAEASPLEPVSAAVKTDAAAKKHAGKHVHGRAAAAASR